MFGLKFLMEIIEEIALKLLVKRLAVLTVRVTFCFVRLVNAGSFRFVDHDPLEIH